MNLIEGMLVFGSFIAAVVVMWCIFEDPYDEVDYDRMREEIQERFKK